MKHRSRRFTLLLLSMGALSLIMGPAGCASTKPRDKWWQVWRPKSVAVDSIYHPDRVMLPPPPEIFDPSSASGGSFALGDARGFDDLTNLPEPPPLRQPPAGMVSDLSTVHFEFDRFDLDMQARQALDRNLQWILNHPGIEIQIEGHCDDRGTMEYNLLLGEKRAKSVKAYLVQGGASEWALHTISYGEERPIEVTSSDSALSKNRRAQFLVY